MLGPLRIGKPLLRQAIAPSTLTRHYSVGQKLKNANNLLRKIGDEKSKESEVTLLYMRRIGVGSILVVLASIAWASTLTDPVVETLEVPDLSKDVRSFR